MKKLKPYFLTSLLVFGILTFIFLIKGIYPFGNHSLIWGDMHDQITAFYYHFYDCFYQNQSLLIDFSTSSGINFLGILAYYILSPFSLFVLFVKREDIYLVVSVIIAFKILTSSLTCLYFIRTYFKKIPYFLSILLAIIYAFSGYSLIMYQITPWIDAMYLFPLIMIGLKKVLDLEKPTLYIITLFLSLVFSFYVSMMVIIFIFLASFIYLLVYQEEKTLRKKAILSLGLSTILSLACSSFIVVPAYLQISISSRVGLDWAVLLNSKTGPITDKVSMLLFGGIVYTGLFFLLKEWKKHKNFLSFYIPVLLIMLIPIFIEPINKIWHFGSYAFFPYRAGFIMMFLLIIGSCYYFNQYEPIHKDLGKKPQIFSILITIIISVSIFMIMKYYYHDFQVAIETLTISIDHKLLLILLFTTLLAVLGCSCILLLNQKINTFTCILISTITFTHILVNTSVYLGMDQEQQTLMSEYQELADISKDYTEGNYYRVKNEAFNMIMNSGMVMKYHTLDHFTSLTDRNNLESLKQMGYSSMWVKTFSKGGNLFLDSILANKYLITREELDSEYYEFIKKYQNLNFYALKKTPSYGYLLTHNDTIFDKENSFEISNSWYQNITGSQESIFEISDTFDTNNIEIVEGNDTTLYRIIDVDANNYLEKEIQIVGKKVLYLEILRSLINNKNLLLFENFNIYINDHLYKQNAFSENDNGSLCLGTFENETVNIKIQFRKSIDLDHITLGVMDYQKYEEFMDTQYIDTNISYHRNTVTAKVNGTQGKILFLPINYNKGYTATNDGKIVEIIPLYENYIGIPLHDGENRIQLSYLPVGFVPCIIISMIGLILTVILLKSNCYQKLLDITWLQNIAYIFYLVIYLGIILLVYVGLTICFIISYFMNISIG